MGKIIGESFDDYVDLQVKIRQKTLGQLNRSNDLLTKITSKNPWIRLASSIDIDEAKAWEVGGAIEFDGSELAKRNILQGGVLRQGSDKTPRGGIIDSYGNDPTQAYGFNSTSEFGIIPLPAVESFEITPKNNGSLTQAKIKVKCFSKKQFQVIETLYLRLGYHLLLEWGHSVYSLNNGDLVTNPIHTSALNALLSPKNDGGVQAVNDAIKKERENSNGNYDGMIGRVTNFDWNVTPDGHYDAEISVISTGDVIESLILSSPLPLEEPEDPEESDDEDTIQEKKEDVIKKTPIGIILKNIEWILWGPRTLGPAWLGIFGDKSVYGATTTGVTYPQETLLNKNIIKLGGFKDITPYSGDIGTPGNYNLTNKEIMFINGEGVSRDWDYYYIKLGALLRIIQNFLLIYNKEPGSKDPIEPIVFIDWDYENNKCYIPLPVFSVDPRVCIIPSRLEEEYRAFGINRTRTFKTLNKLAGTDFFDSEDDAIYNFMHMHINIQFIRQSLIDSINDEGNILFLDFFNKICEGINSSLCNYVDFEPFHDKDTNILHIVNKANSDKLINPPKPVTKFRVGLLPQGEREGSFIKNVSIGSTIPPNFATQIAIGAQANGKQEVTSNSSPFAKWNKGLTDRIFPEKKTSANDAALDEKKAKEEEQATKKFKELQKAVGESIYYYDDFDLDDDLFELSGAVKSYLKIKLNEAEQKDKASSPLIIPLSLSLTMDGLSGIKIFQKYSITEDFLPDNYQDSIEFIVKGIGHSIDEGGWTTKIEGQCIPKVKVNELSGASAKPSGDTPNPIGNIPPPPQTPSLPEDTPNANALRLVLNKLGYREKGEEISNGGDISLQLANYAISVFTEIHSQYPNVKIVVTGGNDLYHQRLSYNSAHKRGDGLDFVITPSDPTTLKNIDLLLQGFAAGNRSPAVSFINEYDNPTKAASGKHFHIRIGRDKSGFDKIQNAYALADQGQLTTYTIT